MSRVIVLRKSTSLLGAAVVMACTSGALAGGTLHDGIFVLSFLDATGDTPMSAENDGIWIYTVSGGSPGGERLARYFQDGTLDMTFAPGIDFRSIFTDNSGNLYAKQFGSGNVYTLTQDGVPTFLYTLNDPESQSSADFNADDTELYTRGGSTIRRYNSANGSFISSFELQGLGGGELAFPAFVQMETSRSGRIFTYAEGVVSEWDTGGNRIGTANILIGGDPGGFNTTWSFGVGGDDYIYLFSDANHSWEVYDVGIPTPGTLALLAVAAVAGRRRRRG